MAKIGLENLSKCFGKVKAVNNINIEIKDGEFLSLLGPSGCGKTTLLRLIAGLETPTSGEIYFDDKAVTDVSPAERNTSMVFQSYALYPHMTIFNNIAFPLQVRKVHKDEINKTVKEAASLLKVDDLLNRKPREISGGQRQRVALARAIVRQPALFLMDEPLSNLDAKLRVYMRAELKRLQNKLGITTIYVTHDQVEAMSMSMRIAVMKDGTIQQLGTSDELYLHPANTWVAGFIGSPPMNLVDCLLVENNDSLFLKAEGLSIPLEGNLAKLIKEKSPAAEVKFGVRPENLSVHKKEQPKAIQGEVYSVEPLGEYVIVDVTVGDNLIKAKTSSDFTSEIGEKIYLTFDEKLIYIYNKDGKLLN